MWCSQPSEHSFFKNSCRLLSKKTLLISRDSDTSFTLTASGNLKKLNAMRNLISWVSIFVNTLTKLNHQNFQYIQSGLKFI